jgi:hypothetical protein
MNTTAAAAQAGVTIPTIRHWCRAGVITAVKRAGRWVIDTASLAHRIAIGARRTRKAAMPDIPITLTSRTRRHRGHIGAVGPADTLRSAFETGQPITLSGKFAGEQVYLGHTRQTYGDYGITLETLGLDQELGENPRHPGVAGAVYLVDLTRLDAAPRLAQLVREAEDKTSAAAMEAERRAAAEEDRYLNNEEY